MVYLQSIQLEAARKNKLNNNQLIVLTTIRTFIDTTGECKMSIEYIAKSLLGSSEKTARNLIDKLVSTGWIYKKSGKYENKKKQERNQYTLSPKCNLIFSKVKTTALSKVKTTDNIKNKKERTSSGVIPAEFFQRYKKYEEDFSKEYADRMLNKWIEQNDTKTLQANS